MLSGECSQPRVWRHPPYRTPWPSVWGANSIPITTTTTWLQPDPTACRTSSARALGAVSRSRYVTATHAQLTHYGALHFGGVRMCNAARCMQAREGSLQPHMDNEGCRSDEGGLWRSPLSRLSSMYPMSHNDVRLVRGRRWKVVTCGVEPQRSRPLRVLCDVFVLTRTCSM